MQPGINQSACGEETTRRTLDRDSQAAAAAAMLGWKFWALLFWKAALDNAVLIKNRRNDTRGCHTCVNAEAWTRRRSCAIILFIWRIWEEEFNCCPGKLEKAQWKNPHRHSAVQGCGENYTGVDFRGEERQSGGSDESKRNLQNIVM